MDTKQFVFKDISTFKYGKLPKKEKIVSYSCNPIYTGYQITGYYDEPMYEEPKLIVVARGVGGTGDVKISPPNAYITNLSIVCDVNTDFADINYLKYYFAKNNLRYLNSGASIAQITIDDLQNVILDLPELDIQNKIVQVLSNYDDLIDNNNKRIKILEEMAQKIYTEWFVDFKFPNHETTTFKQTELGEIPSDWNCRKLKDICSVIFSGGTPTTTTEEYWNGDLNWLSSGETNNKYIINTQKTITELGVKKSSTRLAKTKDVVIASAGQGKTRGQVAYCFIDTFINQSIISMRSIDNIDYSNFIFFNLLSRYDELRLLSDSSSSRGSLTVKIMEDVNIILPSNAIIYKFNEMLAPILGLIKKIQIKQQTLKQTRDLLLPRLISGEIDVENMEVL